LQRVARENEDLFLVAEDDSKIIGSLIAGWDGWRGHLYRVAVDPDHRKRGVGRALVAEAFKRLEAKGARRISILTVTEDAHSVGFWDSLTDLNVVPDPWPKSRYLKEL
jgi:ribosomal protein S18 acetylase RimI-like enzyme